MARVSAKMTKPATDQKNRNVPASMSAVAAQKCGSISRMPLTDSCQYAQAMSPTATMNPATRKGMRAMPARSFAS